MTEKHYPFKIPLLITKKQVLIPNSTIDITLVSLSEVKMLSHILETDNLIGVALQKDQDCFNMGCAGQIENLRYSNNQYKITITGTRRFLIQRKKLSNLLYWNAFVVWDSIEKNQTTLSEHQHNNLLQMAHLMIQKTSSKDTNQTLRKQPMEAIIGELISLESFTPIEKQAILESQSTDSRYELLVSLMNMHLQQTIVQPKNSHKMFIN